MRALTDGQEREVVRAFNEGAAIVDLAKRFGCSTQPIKRVLSGADASGMLTRRRRVMNRLGPEEIAALVAAYVEEGVSRNDLAKRFGITHPTATRLLKEAGAGIRDSRQRRGPLNPIFRDGRHRLAEGYIRIWLDPRDPLAVMANSKGHVLEHRLVMARNLGRPLFPYERVHHLNGVRDDNRIENLELWEESHPPGQRAHEATHAHCPTCTCMEEAA